MPPGYKVCSDRLSESTASISILISFPFVGALRRSVRRLSVDSCGLKSAFLFLAPSHYVIMTFGAKMAIQPVCGQIPPIVWWGSWDVYRNNTFFVSAFINGFYCRPILSQLDLASGDRETGEG
jgi:hypothetical protein